MMQEEEEEEEEEDAGRMKKNDAWRRRTSNLEVRAPNVPDGLVRILGL